MPLLTQEKAIKEYFEQVQHKYPGVSFDRFAEACKAPGNFIKHCIKGATLPLILVKHLGKFRVFKSKIKDKINDEEAYFKKGITTKEVYESRVNFYKEYLTELNRLQDEETNDDSEG